MTAYARVLVVLLVGVAIAVAAGTSRRVAAQDDAPTAAIVAGSCTDPGAATDRLREFRARGDGDDAVLTSFSVIDRQLADLLAADHALTVSTGGDLVACAEITGPEEIDLYLALRSRNASGYAGIAWLHQRDDQTQVSLFIARDLNGDDAPDDGDDPPPPPPDDDDDDTDDDTEDCAGLDEWLPATTDRIERAQDIGAELNQWFLDADEALARYEQGAEELAIMARDQADSDPPLAVADLNRDLTNVFADTAEALEDVTAAIRNTDVRALQRAADRLTELGQEGEQLAIEVEDLSRRCRDTG
jgi:hypothetical protein